MAVTPFGEWLPDQVAFGHSGMVIARNVMPAPGGLGYSPFPSLVAALAALPGPPRGIILAEVPGGIRYTYAGTDKALYVLAGSGWSNVSATGGYSLDVDDRWEFCQYGKKIIAVCGSAAPMQVIDIGAPKFAPLATSSRKPLARRIGLIDGTPVIAHTFDDQDGEQPSRVWWCRRIAVPDITDWTPNLSTRCGYTTGLPQASDGGVMRLIAGETGFVSCRHAIYRFRFVPGNTLVQLDRLVRGKGPLAAGAIVDDGRMTYFLDEDGFYVFDGETTQPIGHAKVDETITRRLNRSALDTITSAVMGSTGMILFALPLDGAPSPTHVIVYAWKEQRFSEAVVGMAQIGESAVPGISLTEEPWASRVLTQQPWANYRLTAPEFSGGARVLTALDQNGNMFYVSGPGMPAILETAEEAPFEPLFAKVTQVRPVIDGADGVTVQIGQREAASDDVIYTAPVPLNRVGVARVRARGVYLRTRINIPAGFRQAVGSSMDPRPGGRA